VDLKNQEFIKELFEHNGLSVTALNNYLECPWKYFYTNLLRIPRAKVKHQMYGTAIHAALKDFFDKGITSTGSGNNNLFSERVRESKSYDKDFLLSQFEYYLKNEPLREADLEESLTRGRVTLGGYYDAHHSGWIKNIINEMNITGILLTPEIRLTGKIDKVEILDENQNFYSPSLSRGYLNVNVVDYKTGRPKTRGEIEGATKNSNGDIKRQLVFYNLLLNNYSPSPSNGCHYKMVSGDIDFVEPDEKGRYRKERFIIAPAEVAALEEQIKKVSAEILSAAFWGRRCKEKECEFCALREMIV
jgi:DNA helicase-2/ATP-dependent DNA helicase PcrA